MKSIMLVVSTAGQLPDMIRLAQLIKSHSSEYHPFIYFNIALPREHSAFRTLSKLQINHFDYSLGYNYLPLEEPEVHSSIASDEQASGGPGKSNRVKKQVTFTDVKDFFKFNTPGFFKLIKKVVYILRTTDIEFVSLVLRQYRRKIKEKQILTNYNVSLIILAEDSVDYFTPVLVGLGQKRGIKSIIFPYTLAGTSEFLVDAFFNRRTTSKNVLHFLTGFLFPKWKRFYNGLTLIKSKPALIWTSQLFGRSPPEPWLMNSGFADKIFVESSFMYDYFVARGIEKNRLEISGFPALDQLALSKRNRARLRKELAENLKLSLDKKWIVCSVPPSQWPRTGLNSVSYLEMLEKYFNCFAAVADEVAILCKFHPRLEPEDYQPVCDKFGLKVLTQDTIDCIAIADIYVASVSATMRWALASLIPVINFDVYNYNYGDFDNCPEVQTAFTPSECEAALKKALDISRNDFSNDQNHKARNYYGKLDFSVSARIIERIEQNCK